MKGVHPANNSMLIKVLNQYLNSDNITLVDLAFLVIGNICGDSQPLSNLVLDCTKTVQLLHNMIANNQKLKSYRVENAIWIIDNLVEFSDLRLNVEYKS